MCGFGREIDEAKIPPRAQMATCPKCAHKFRFRVVDLPDSTPAEPPHAGWKTSAPDGSGDSGAAPSGSMHAPRAAAQDMWRRLQSPQGENSRPEDVPPTTGAAEEPEGGESPSVLAESLGQDASASASMTPPSAQRNPSGETPGTEGSAGDPASDPTPWVRKTSAWPVPFEDLRTVGFFPGLWGTIRLVLSKPSAFFKSMPIHGGMAKPLAFHLLLAELMVVCQYVWSLFGIGATAEYLGRPEVMDMGLGLAQAAPVMLLLIYPLLLVLRLMIMTGVIHALLLLVRAGGSGAEATFRVLCYAAAPLALGVIPGIGPLIGGIWSIGLTVIGLKQAHRTRASAALFAVAVPILLMLAAIIGLLQGMSKAA
jgi:hypothetical protein